MRSFKSGERQTCQRKNCKRSDALSTLSLRAESGRSTATGGPDGWLGPNDEDLFSSVGDPHDIKKVADRLDEVGRNLL